LVSLWRHRVSVLLLPLRPFLNLRPTVSIPIWTPLISDPVQAGLMR
jgi:hypothetical protein